MWPRREVAAPSVAQIMPAQLMALDDGPSILLDKPVLLLGRHPECDIQIDSRKISRKHCVIAQVNDYLVVRDLGSTNGIRINGVRVAEGRLASGDELAVGNYRYRLIWDTVPESPKMVRGAPRAGGPSRDPDDELLESLEEPVPLGDPEPFDANLPHPAIDGAPPPFRPATAKAGLSPPPALPPVPRAPAEDPLILPDHLELVPLSEVLPDSPSKHASGSPPPVEPV
jgi:predicted component of type VI protein secretion system